MPTWVLKYQVLRLYYLVCSGCSATPAFTVAYVYRTARTRGEKDRAIHPPPSSVLFWFLFFWTARLRSDDGIPGGGEMFEGSFQKGSFLGSSDGFGC